MAAPSNPLPVYYNCTANKLDIYLELLNTMGIHHV